MIRRLAGMPSIRGWLVAAIGAAVMLIGATAATASAPTLNWGTQLNAAQCGPGQLVINVTYKVVNDADSGVTGNYWAYDNYTKHIQVYDVGDGSYCAVVSYLGSFVTVATVSPQGTDSDMSAGIRGSWEGGYRSTIFTGTLKSTPDYSARGNIGLFDFGWAGDSTAPAPTPFGWLGAYFSSTSGFDLAWWGWIYHADNNGTWVNSSGGNFGDITN